MIGLSREGKEKQQKAKQNGETPQRKSEKGIRREKGQGGEKERKKAHLKAKDKAIGGGRRGAEWRRRMWGRHRSADDRPRQRQHRRGD